MGNFVFANDYDKKWANAFEDVLKREKGESWAKLYGRPDSIVAGSCDSAREAVMEPGGLLAKPLLSKLKVVVKVGKTVFVHGGLTTEHLHKHGGIAGLNEMAKDWILEPEHKSSEKSLCELDWDSCLWIRDYSSPPNRPAEPGVGTKLVAVLDSLNALRMVVGHTTQEKTNSIFNSKVWRIDVRDGVPAWLRFSLEFDISSEALEIACDVYTQTETVSVLKHIRHSDGSVSNFRISSEDRQVGAKIESPPFPKPFPMDEETLLPGAG